MKSLKINLYFTAAIAMLFSFFSNNTLASSVLVQYQINDKVISSVGEHTPNGYSFNLTSDKEISLATLDWPPYIGEQLCNKGWVFQFVVALLINKGYQVNVHFFPWARSVKMTELGNIDILFPEYFIEDSAPSDVVPGKKRRELLVQSNQFPGGNISFVKRKGDTINFDGNLRQLAGQTIGVVRGYQNTPEFDSMMDEGLISVIEAVDELQLIKLLTAQRVNLIIGDPIVFQYTINHADISQTDKAALLASIEEVSPALQYNHLYLAISLRYPKWRSLLKDINLSLLEFEQSGETDRIIKQGSTCSEM